jgi:hypothetical protein
MVVRVISPEELAVLVRDLPPPREDDVTVLADGTRLDTPEKLLAYVNEQQIRDGLPQLEALD